MNKYLVRIPLSFVFAVCIFLQSGCDWSSGGGSDSFNTSKGAGVNVNFSGVYSGEIGGRVVSGQNITKMTIAQTGNRINLVDNNGSTYEGSVGSPGLVANPTSSGTYPAGAELVQGQMNFSGVNNATGRKISFAGIVHVVTVTDIQGDSSTTTDTKVDQESTTTETRTTDGLTTTITTTETIISPDGLSITERVTVTVIDNATGLPVTNPTTTTTVRENTDSSNVTAVNTTITEFRITEANSQYRLEGTWIEEGGGSHSVQARSPGTSGLIQTTTTATTDTGAATQ